jgi:hypothetical protein
MLVDFKYNTKNPNMFTCKEIGVSNFWKGVLWATRVTRMGYRWKLGKGTRIRFGEDVRIGTSSLAIQYWEIYCLINEHNKYVAKLWDRKNLKCTFRRSVDRRLFDMWDELVEHIDHHRNVRWRRCTHLAIPIQWVYSSQSLYSVINFRGITPVFVPAVWKLRMPPRVHFFLSGYSPRIRS